MGLYVFGVLSHRPALRRFQCEPERCGGMQFLFQGTTFSKLSAKVDSSWQTMNRIKSFLTSPKDVGSDYSDPTKVSSSLFCRPFCLRKSKAS